MGDNKERFGSGTELAEDRTVVCSCILEGGRHIAKRSKPHFMSQWASTGALNAQVEEAFTGHELVKVFGHRGRAIEEFDEAKRHLLARLKTAT